MLKATCTWLLSSRKKGREVLEEHEQCSKSQAVARKRKKMVFEHMKMVKTLLSISEIHTKTSLRCIFLTYQIGKGIKD